MTDPITSFHLFWHDHSCSSVYDVLHEKISIHRKQNILLFFQYDGCKNCVGNERIKLDKEQVNVFFAFLEKQSGKWESDQQIKTYDGVTWEMLMWHSSHKLTKVCGALDDPPQGKQIKKYIRSLIENGRSLIYPQLFE